jgi:hypothetical protein
VLGVAVSVAVGAAAAGGRFGAPASGGEAARPPHAVISARAVRTIRVRYGFREFATGTLGRLIRARLLLLFRNSAAGRSCRKQVFQCGLLRVSYFGQSCV